MALRWIEIVLIPVLLSLEVYLYCRGTFTDIERARWASQMAVSIVWGAYAAALLFIGFLVRVRSLRLSGLALFGLTALKLVLVDIAKVKDLYRIVAFLVLGALMVWASYLYHKIEKRMEEGMRTPE